MHPIVPLHKVPLANLQQLQREEAQQNERDQLKPSRSTCLEPKQRAAIFRTRRPRPNGLWGRSQRELRENSLLGEEDRGRLQ